MGSSNTQPDRTGTHFVLTTLNIKSPSSYSKHEDTTKLIKHVVFMYGSVFITIK